MAISIKGIFRGLKIIAQIFTVQREHEIEIEIGYPTDVRHVSHVGFGGASGSCPSWVKDHPMASRSSSSRKKREQLLGNHLLICMIFCLVVLYPEQMNEFRAEEVAAAGGGGGASISSAVQSRQTS